MHLDDDCCISRNADYKFSANLLARWQQPHIQYIEWTTPAVYYTEHCSVYHHHHHRRHYE